MLKQSWLNEPSLETGGVWWQLRLDPKLLRRFDSVNSVRYITCIPTFPLQLTTRHSKLVSVISHCYVHNYLMHFEVHLIYPGM